MFIKFLLLIRLRHNMAQVKEERDENGLSQVYIWKGYQEVKPETLLSLQGVQVHHVSVGGNHCAFLSRAGALYMYGDNSHGQQGNNTFTDCFGQPELVKDFTDDFIIDVGCGARHTGAVTSHGAVWCWGDNSAGQCGQEGQGKFPHPMLVSILDNVAQPCEHGPTGVQKVDSFNPVRAMQVSCGADHSMMVSDYGEIWAWGTGPQLGLNTVDRVTTPRRLEYLINRRVLSIKCGASHTLALVQKLPRKYMRDSSTQRCGSVDSTRSGSSAKGTPDSPVVNGVQSHRYRPQTCARCKQEMYTYLETNDTCIINNKHKCPLGLELDHQMASGVSSHPAGTKIGEQVAKPAHSAAHRIGLRPSRSLDCSPNRVPIRHDLPKQSSLPQDTTSFSTHLSEETYASAAAGCRNSFKDQSDSADPIISEDEVDQKGEQSKSLLRAKSAGMTISTKAAQELGSQGGSSKSTAADTVHSPSSGGGSIPWQEHSTGSNRSITKSRSTFLDETEAKEFLDHCLYGDQSSTEGQARSLSSGSSPPQSPLVRKIQENIRQYVPTSPSAMQDAVTTFTKNVFSNVRASIDRFGFVANVGTIMEGDSLSSKSSSQDSVGLRGRDATMEDMGKLEFVRAGTMPKSISVGSPVLRVKGHSPCHRRGSLPNGAIVYDKGPRVTTTEVVLDTEVWSWGSGNRGQLGHGDLLDRCQPCLVKTLTGKKIVKVVAGSCHSMALAATCQVYSWGLNNHGQLSNSDTTAISSPHKIQVFTSLPACDIAAGANHSLVMADGPSYSPYTHYSGRQPAGVSAGHDTEKALLIRINCLRKLGWLQQIGCGGDLCACIVDHDPSGFVATLHEFAATERAFLLQLDTISNVLLGPLLISEHMVNFLTSPVGMAIQLVIDAFLHVINKVSSNHVELFYVIQHKMELEKIRFLREPDKATATFQHYGKCYADVLSLGGFEQCAKQGKPFFEEIKDKLHKLSLEVDSRTKAVSSFGSLLTTIMQLPFTRLKDYNKLVARLAMKYPADEITCYASITQSTRHGVGTLYTSEHYKLNQIALTWEAVRLGVNTELALAENTKAFWESCPAKLADSLKTCGRRLLRDSKNHPLSWQSAGRFSSNVFMLFNDAFVHVQYSTHQMHILPTVWVEAVQDIDSAKNVIILTTPEENLTLTAPTPSDKAEWLWALNQAIDKALKAQKNLTVAVSSLSARGMVGSGVLTPPRDRQATHVFTKLPQYKDARYIGMWRNGKMHGQGELEWPDGRKYTGKFKEGEKEGFGIYLVPKEDSSPEIYEGYWKAGKMHGCGSIRYANGDVYEGYFNEGKRCGHGVLKQGKFTSSLASIYIGEWSNDKRNGYGVHDDILKGQKYMGTWLDDAHHGNGVIVTLDGMYFEGNFFHSKMTGFGLLMTDDNSCYEGEFNGGPNLSGKGVLTMANGDYIEGTFNGSFTEGIKVNGTFYKAAEPVSERKGFTHALGLLPMSFGKLCVPSDRKWEEVIAQCYALLGCYEEPSVSITKVWERVAAYVTLAKKVEQEENTITEKSASPSKRLPRSDSVMDDIEKIPTIDSGQLTVETYLKINAYLLMALETPLHPLGKLVENLVNVYRATYVGVGAHPRLLYHATEEVKSYVRRIYPIIRLLFPTLPESHQPVELWSEDHCSDGEEEVGEEEEKPVIVITPAGLLYPLLLPKVYPPLFTLYALYNEKEDEKYWRRVNHWNKQSDVALMAYLDMDQRFWLVENEMFDQVEDQRRVSTIRDKSYNSAVDTLQRIGTSFSPADKLLVIQQTFNEMNKMVQANIGAGYLWSMDDLFPVFQYVVVRARIQHLGAEIHFIDDLMEDHLELGELGIMFTTLKACYFQIQNEKIM